MQNYAGVQYRPLTSLPAYPPRFFPLPEAIDDGRYAAAVQQCAQLLKKDKDASEAFAATARLLKALALAHLDRTDEAAELLSQIGPQPWRLLAPSYVPVRFRGTRLIVLLL